MGVIEDVYEDVEADVPFEEFEAAVEEKVEQMGGLADEETAAMLIAHELRDEEVNRVADIKPGMDDVKFLAKVMTVGEVRTFERDGDDEEDGHVLNVEVADESGRITISMWDGMAVDAADRLQPGDVLRVMGRPKEGYNGLEVAVDKAEPDDDAEVDVEALDEYRVEDLQLGASDVTLVGRVLDTDSVRTFDRDDGTEGRVANLTLGDETGRIRVTLWDERADRATELASGETVEVVDGYVRERDGSLELHVGNRGSIEAVDADVEYVPETTDIADLEMDETVDIAGGVIETSEKRTFDRDDGSQGQVRNVRVKDDTDEIRVALWGEKADKDIDLADRVVFTDVEIQDGWQDDIEASAGWRSTVSVLERASGGGSAEATGDRDPGQGGLDAFESNGSDGSSESADADTGGSAGAGGSGGAAAATAETDADDADAAGEVEFTGTVVQAGDPVVLDDGTETRSVNTGANLRLGEEVTVRGRERDGTIDADDVF
ncbi:single-stranded DNA binding protein [Candidatus Halobonum tyrrellensis]|uniref:Replication factor A n=1 Tax=Candidatus Halobonum tyrrellensis G22 TaxID=1324957 RepID=V4J1L9_9EURY|nr:single-stranded DNA binding protein [Candidatus Halobonum tyrrellensis]ESP89302.1 replication factor A [Candidatus Halobonum tyrrellensis G22]